MLDLTDAEKDRQLRSRLIEILNVLEGTPPVSNRLQPRWAAFLSILMVEWWIVYEESFFADSFDDSLGGFHFNDVAHGGWIHGGVGNSGGIRSEGRCHSCWRLCLIRPGGNA